MSLSTLRAFLNGVGVLGDMLSKFRLIRGVRYGSSELPASFDLGVFSVVFCVLVVFAFAGVDVSSLFVPVGEFRNCDGENGSDLIGVLPLGLVHFGSPFTALPSVSCAWSITGSRHEHNKNESGKLWNHPLSHP